MTRTMLKSKIHRCVITHADLHYVGSITIAEDLMAAADLVDGEQVAVVNITNGSRLETYAITGEAGSGVIGMNGAAAHLMQPGDLIIIMSYTVLDDALARAWRPSVVHVDSENRIVQRDHDAAAPVPGQPDQRSAPLLARRTVS